MQSTIVFVAIALNVTRLLLCLLVTFLNKYALFEFLYFLLVCPNSALIIIVNVFLCSPKLYATLLKRKIMYVHLHRLHFQLRLSSSNFGSKCLTTVYVENFKRVIFRFRNVHATLISRIVSAAKLKSREIKVNVFS